MIKIDSSKILVFDADVIIHFITGDRLLDLFNIFSNDCVIIQTVYDELSRNYKTKETLDNLINLGTIKVITLSNKFEIIKEFAHLTSSLMNKGRGESACMAYCKFTKDVIASSNLKDIGRYCELHKIPYLTTFDFIYQAYLTDDSWTMDDCDKFISKLVAKHRIPFDNLQAYIENVNISKAS